MASVDGAVEAQQGCSRSSRGGSASEQPENYDTNPRLPSYLVIPEKLPCYASSISLLSRTYSLFLFRLSVHKVGVFWMSLSV